MNRVLPEKLRRAMEIAAIVGAKAIVVHPWQHLRWADCAAELKEQYEAKLKDIDKEAEDILSDARRRALQNEERIVAQAKEEAGRILARAQEEARLEKQKMSDEIKQEIVSVASVMAGKLVGASIDTARQNSLIEETLKEMGEDTWQN